jgi:hypothetical protein
MPDTSHALYSAAQHATFSTCMGAACDSHFGFAGDRVVVVGDACHASGTAEGDSDSTVFPAAVAKLDEEEDEELRLMSCNLCNAPASSAEVERAADAALDAIDAGASDAAPVYEEFDALRLRMHNA